MVHWGDLALLLFLGRVSGVWRLHVVCRFLFGQLRGGRFSQQTIWGKEAALLWIGIAFVNVMGRVDHLLLHCGKVFRLWSFALRSFGVSWVLPKRVIDMLASWRNWLGKRSSNVWNLVPHCMMWIIWRERNNCIFEDLVFFGDKLLTLFATLCLIGLVHGDLLPWNPFRCF